VSDVRQINTTCKIGGLQNGEFGYAVPWAVEEYDGNYWISPYHSLDTDLEATANMYVTRVNYKLWFIMPAEPLMNRRNESYAHANALPASPYLNTNAIVLRGSFVLFHKLKHEGIEYPALIDHFDSAEQAVARVTALGLKPGEFQVYLFA